MFNTIKAKNEAIEILRNYSGKNPYILSMKRDVIILQKTSLLTECAVEYIISNKDREAKNIGKVLRIADWYGEKLKATYDIEFVPTKLQILTFLGETSNSYHCVIKYRQNMNPLELFIPKKALLGNFLIDDYHNVQVDFERYDKLSMSKDPNRKIKPHQKEAVQFLLSRKKCILADDMGLGKMEPLTSIIPTPNGFKKMGDIKKGDMVFDMHGNDVEVLNTFRHENKDIYEITFSDGTKVKCGLEHLWYVQNINWKKKEWRTMSLEEILKIGLHNKISNSHSKQGTKKRNKWFVPTVEPVKYHQKEYFIHPYVLGMCIGDGNLCNGSINISIPNFEQESVNRIESLLTEGYKLSKRDYGNCPQYCIVKDEHNNAFKNSYIQEINRLGLNVHGNEKFIPYEYKIGSIEQRKELLMGLMDSDGSITKTNNKICYSTNSQMLANDVAELVFSLGGIARISSYNRVKNGKNTVEYHVRIQVNFCPFKIQRKAERYNPTFKKYLTRYIENVELVGKEDAQCIYVDSPEHTYVTGKHYVVTHNTLELTVASIEGNFDSVIIICPASLKTNWKKELMWYVPERDITIIESPIGMTKPELEKFLGYGEGRSGLTVKELQEEAKDKGKWEDNRFVIVNFDVLEEFYKIPVTRSKENIQKALEESPMLRYIMNKKSLIIIDEAHRLSNNTSIRYKIIKDLIKRGKPDSIYLATGTPITNNPQNLYCVLQFLDDPITNDWQYYMDRYCGAMKIPAKGEKEKYTNFYLKKKNKASWYDLTQNEKDELKQYIKDNARHITIAKDGTNLEELKLRISHIYLRRTKEDLASGLPNKTIHEVFYDFNMLQQMEYAKLWDEYEAAQLEVDPTKEINKELLETAIYRKYCSNQMVPNTIKMTDEFISKGEKVIIATCYDEELEMFRDYYGERCVIYNGKMNAKQKDAAQKAFMEDPNVMVFIGNIQAASVGLTLIVSHTLIFNNMSFVPSDCRQMEDRIYRIGQTKDVDIYYQMFKGTQYEKIWNIILKKELIINAVIKTEYEKINGRS